MRSYTSPHAPLDLKSTRRATLWLAALVCALVLFGHDAHAAPPAQSEDTTQTQAHVLGELFCDDNQDGRRNTGESGIGGARILSDHGWEAISDNEGRWHINKFQPGQHLIKLNEASLPPWAKLVGSPRRRFLSTGGLIQTMAFPLSCTGEWSKPEGIDLGEKTPLRPTRPWSHSPADLSHLTSTSTDTSSRPCGLICASGERDRHRRAG